MIYMVLEDDRTKWNIYIYIYIYPRHSMYGIHAYIGVVDLGSIDNK